jgi:ERCC4-related helicase
MTLTPYHAKYFAHELTKRSSSESVEKLASALSDAQVDLNPHQIEAALFAFRSPLSRGAILADEVGLGKTIEAGILLAQRWAERRRRLLVICPANLRKQWSQELADKFYLPSVILETRTFNEAVKRGNLNPFQQDAVIICSFQFARSKEPYVRQAGWELVVIDEAHRLRNVYKQSNKVAQAIKQAVAPFRKVLLTATPLQNSLLELYGLVSILDEHIFGDLKSFKAQYSRLGSAEQIPEEAALLEAVFRYKTNPTRLNEKILKDLNRSIEKARSEPFAELKQRIKPICQRTLRKQVLEYVPYTTRHAIVQEFVPNLDELRLYHLVSDYLQRPTLYALPASQRQLMTLILRKLLASSTYAISDTLKGLANKLQAATDAAEQVQAPTEQIADNFEMLPEIEDEWAEDDEDSEDSQSPAAAKLTPQQLQEMKQETETLREFHTLARSIQKNSKGEVLLTALRKGFAAAVDAQKGQGGGALQQKALIFTESRRTQEYLFEILEQTQFAGKVVLFNGSNTDPKSQQIYRQWSERHAGTDRITGSPTADKRAALVDYFRDEAYIMIATEAAAEGINLQFCNLVVNYDLPWNPQRIEQRIGRCHRYGQKFDVVVVNFLNKSNAADQRVYELLDEKFKLFNGIFGASDEVLGAIESGVDFEKRIMAIYQRCRTPQQISFEFDQLQQELETEIGEKRSEAREQLLNNFDQEVIERVRIASADSLSRFEALLWKATQFFLEPYARFEPSGHAFTLLRNPFSGEPIHPGPYRMGKRVEDANTYRVGHPLAQQILERCKGLDTPPVEVCFHYSSSGKRISLLDPLVGRSGWLLCSRLTIQTFDTEDHLLFAATDDAGTTLEADACKRLFDLPATTHQPVLPMSEDELRARVDGEQEAVTQRLSATNGKWFDVEMEKLDRWAEDQRKSLKADVEELEESIRAGKRDARLAPNLPEKLRLQQQVRQMEARHTEALLAYKEACAAIDARKDALLDETSKRLQQQAERQDLFLIRWQLE